MSLHNRLQLHTEDSLAVLQTLVTQQEAALGHLVTLLTDTVEQGYRIWTMGQGFSHLLAQYTSEALSGGLGRERVALPCLCLSGQPVHTNLERQVMALCQPGDLLLAFVATPVMSADMVASIRAAHERQMNVAFFGTSVQGESPLRLDDVQLCVPHDRLVRVQEAHLLLVHTLIDSVDAFFLGE